MSLFHTAFFLVSRKNPIPATIAIPASRKPKTSSKPMLLEEAYVDAAKTINLGRYSMKR